jgi:hypothetical protein
MADRLTPSRTVITSFTPRKHSLLGGDDFEAGDWVLSLASSTYSNPNRTEQQQLSTTTTPTISAALSTCKIIVYDQQRLHPLQTYHSVHGSNDTGNINNNVVTINAIEYGPQHMLVSVGQDGSVVAFDLRQSVPAFRTQLLQQAAVSVAFGYDGWIAALGSKSSIHFMDMRATGSLLGSYTNSHTDYVTTLQFEGSKLLSGAEDGLACVFDTTQPTEELALHSVLNVGAPLRRVGFCTGSNTVYCLTGNETCSLWNKDSATLTTDFGPHLRSKLGCEDLSVDYLIDAHWDSVSRELIMTAGNVSGGAALYRLDPLQLTWGICDILTGGHRGVVRAACHLSQTVIVTAGEDARLCEWNRLRRQTHAANKSHRPFAPRVIIPQVTNGGGGPVRRPRHRQGVSPY